MRPEILNQGEVKTYKRYPAAATRSDLALSPVNKPNQHDSLDGFLLQEFTAIRSEIDLQIVERRKVEGQMLVGVAVYYSWLITSTFALAMSSLNLLLVLPVVAVFLGFLRWTALMLPVINLGKYIRTIEARFGGGSAGWEHFLQERRERNPFIGRFEGYSGIWFWVVLWVVTILALFLLWKSPLY